MHLGLGPRGLFANAATRPQRRAARFGPRAAHTRGPRFQPPCGRRSRCAQLTNNTRQWGRISTDRTVENALPCTIPRPLAKSYTRGSKDRHRLSLVPRVNRQIDEACSRLQDVVVLSVASATSVSGRRGSDDRPSVETLGRDQICLEAHCLQPYGDRSSCEYIIAADVTETGYGLRGVQA